MRNALTVMLVVAGFAVAGAANREPYYCWLAFGPEGKVRALVRLEGSSITLQRQVGDQIKGEPQRFGALKDCKGVTVEDPDGKTAYVIAEVMDPGLAPALGRVVIVTVDIKGPIGYRQACYIQLARQLEKAPVVRFNAPLIAGPVEDMQSVNGTLAWKPKTKLYLVKGDKPAELCVTIRNKAAERGSYVVVMTTDEAGKKCLFPDGVRPIVDVEFPPLERGAKPVERRYVLDQFC